MVPLVPGSLWAWTLDELILLCLVVVTTISCSPRDDDSTCHPQDRLVGWGEVAADRALSCASFIEVDGLPYGVRYEAPRGCVEVDPRFLGKDIALSDDEAVARSIDGVPRHVALALAFPNPENHSGGCVGWHLWEGFDNTVQEERDLQEVVCRVVPAGKPDPESCLSETAV